MKRLKMLVDKEQYEEARGVLRRMWRGGSSGVRGRPMVLLSLSSSVVRRPGSQWGLWPSEPDEAGKEERAKRLRRGGMGLFLDPQPEPAKRKSAYEVLGALEFGLDEMSRSARSLSVDAVDWRRPLIDALLQAALAGQGREAVVAELLDRVESGRVNKIQFVQLLDLMEDEAFAPEQQAALRELLDQLVRTVDPTDSAQIVRLAKVYGSAGNRDIAALLYRWAALFTGGSGIGGGPVEPRALVKAAKEHLDEAQLTTLVEEILSWSRPQERVFRFGREQYETTWLELWQEVADPAEALERCRPMCLEIVDVSKSLRRDSAKAAVTLLARSGEVDLALRCLEVAFCKLPTAGVEVEYVFYLRDYERPGRFGQPDFRNMFPVDSGAWVDPLGWYERAGSSMLDWLQADRMDVGSTVRAVSVIACRMSALGENPKAAALLQRLENVEGIPFADELWLVDAWRAIGELTKADQLEQQMLLEGRLVVPRAVEVVQRAAEQEGAEQALALGAAAAEMTNDEALLDLLASLCDELGKSADAESWRKLSKETKAARKALGVRTGAFGR